MATTLRLISHKLCPYVQRAVIALSEKGVAFERIDIDLANKPDWFLKISPLGKVPVLLVRTADGEAALFESNVICEYIEDTQAGAKLHPRDALQRAQHRAWMEFGSTILSELWGLETTGDPAIFESKRQAVAAKFARVEEALGAGRFFAGESFSLVDAISIGGEAALGRDGGEQSGHLIFRDYASTGDGLVAALQILRIMKARGQVLSELANEPTTNWPGLMCLTALPTSSTMPQYSWPIGVGPVIGAMPR